jgi:hypothetical protein
VRLCSSPSKGELIAREKVEIPSSKWTVTDSESKSTNHMLKGGGAEMASTERIGVLTLLVLMTGVVITFAGDKPTTISLVNHSTDYVAKLNALVAKGSDESLNAQPCYFKAFALYVASQGEPNAVEVHSWPTELSEGRTRVLRKWVEANSAALDELRLGARKPDCWFQYRGESLWKVGQAEYLSKARKLFWALLLGTKFRAVDGDVEGAIGDIAVCYRFGCDMRKGLLLQTQMTAWAVQDFTLDAAFQLMAKMHPDAGLLRVLQEHVLEFSAAQPWLVDLRGQRLATLDAVQSIFGLLPPEQHREMTLDTAEHIASGLAEMFDMNFSPEQVQSSMLKDTPEKLGELTDRMYQYYGSIVSKTPFQWRQERIDIQYKSYSDGVKHGNVVLSAVALAIDRVSEQSVRCRARRDALVTTLALFRYKNDKRDLPDDLKALVSAGYMGALPMDPYSDGPLSYRRMENGFTLYSVGADYHDDGGRHSDDWASDRKGADYVFWPVEGK